MIATDRTYNVFTIASSAGGLEALTEIASRLPADFPGSIFITQHTSPLNRRCYLTDILDNRSKLKVHTACDNGSFSPSTIYVAPPDRHLLIRDNYTELTYGPRENHTRPAADPMFRSAAVSHGGQAVGIVLTGYLDDGSSGLIAIKACGGKAIVQDPDDASVPDMPLNAISYVSPDYIQPVAEIAETMCRLANANAGVSIPPSEEVLLELEYARSFKSDIAAEERLGELSPYMCPDCDGQMWRSKVDPVPRFRCHVGHAHTLRSLGAAQTEVIEKSAWSTFRLLQEQVRTFRQMAEHEREFGRFDMAKDYDRRAALAERRSTSIRDSFEDWEAESNDLDSDL